MRFSLVAAVLWAGTTGLAQERYIDFRGKPVPVDLKSFGPLTEVLFKPAEDGLHLTLAKDRKDLNPVGLSQPVQLPGDFDVIAAVEILRAEEPAGGHGVGVLLGVKHSVRVGRLARAKGEQVVVWDHNVGAGTGKPKLEGDSFPCQALEFRLRLKRKGGILHFLWAPGLTDGAFQEIHQKPFAEDVGLVKFIAQTGKQPCALDVRLLELRIVSGGEAADVALPPQDPAPASGRRWWLVGAVAVVLLVAVALTLIRGRR